MTDRKLRPFKKQYDLRGDTGRFRLIMTISAVIVIIAVIIIFSFQPSGPLGQFNMQQDLAKIETQTCDDYHAIDNSKVVILTFDDSRKSQYLYAAPTLQKCGFKATFFTVCNYLGQDSSRMTWDDIITLHNNGQDIESHTMNHYDLAHLSLTSLDYEVGQSQKCLNDHQINSTIFASPYGNAWNNKTIIDTVSKYYLLERDGYSPLMFLHCTGWTAYTNQTDCRTYSGDGSLNFASRYSIRAWDHNYYDISLSHNDTRIIEMFVKEVNSQSQFNADGTVRAIPIIAYHNVDFVESDYNTDVGLFAKEMNYLHENGFRVLPMTDLGYNQKDNILYIK